MIPFILSVLKQYMRIAFSVVIAHMADHTLIAYVLYVAAEQDPGDPDERIEPMKTENQITCDLCNVVTMLPVHAFNASEKSHLFFFQIRRKINLGSDHAEQKRRIDPVAKINAVLQRF